MGGVSKYLYIYEMVRFMCQARFLNCNRGMVDTFCAHFPLSIELNRIEGTFVHSYYYYLMHIYVKCAI